MIGSRARLSWRALFSADARPPVHKFGASGAFEGEGRLTQDMIGLRTLRSAPACSTKVQSVREVFEHHASFVWRSLRHLGVHDADLEDLTQEVFVVVHRHFGAYDERDKLRAWLYAICSRVAKAHFRKTARRREHVTPAPPEGDAEPAQLEHLERREAFEHGKQLIAALSEEQRAVFLLYEVERMSMPDVAATLGCPLQTAYSRLHAARKRVLSLVADARGRGDFP